MPTVNATMVATKACRNNGGDRDGDGNGVKVEREKRAGNDCQLCHGDKI